MFIKNNVKLCFGDSINWPRMMDAKYGEMVEIENNYGMIDQITNRINQIRQVSNQITNQITSRQLHIDLST